MKLTTLTHVSVDGVMQGLGGSDEDRRGGFERGGGARAIARSRALSTSSRGIMWSQTTYKISAGGTTTPLPSHRLPLTVAPMSRA